jgi:hypothetical protein
MWGKLRRESCQCCHASLFLLDKLEVTFGTLSNQTLFDKHCTLSSILYFVSHTDTPPYTPDAMSGPPTLINLPPSDPMTPSDAPGTPNSTTTSMSELSTSVLAMPDNHPLLTCAIVSLSRMVIEATYLTRTTRKLPHPACWTLSAPTVSHALLVSSVSQPLATLLPTPT